MRLRELTPHLTARAVEASRAAPVSIAGQQAWAALLPRDPSFEGRKLRSAPVDGWTAVRVRVPFFVSQLLLTCSVIAALAWTPGADAKRHPAFRHTKVAAERNVLRSPIFFLRRGGRGASLVDPRTKLFRTNVAVVCSGRKRRERRAHAFTCVVRYGKVRVRVRYVATGARAFRLARAR